MKKAKSFIYLLFVFTLLIISLSACNVKSRDKTQGLNEQNENSDIEPVDITILSINTYEKDVNIVRDQLTKAGFNVKLNIQPDYGSYVGQLESGNYDMSIAGWTTVTGNPDYAVRSLFLSGGDYNKNGLSDSVVDSLIEKASQETPEEYIHTYKEFEKVMVDENAYLVPLYANLKSQAVNKDVMKVDSVKLCKSRSIPWELLDYIDEDKREIQNFLFSQATSSDLASLDPIRANEGSINILNTNMYVRLVNLTQEDQVTSDGSLSYNHVIADGNKEYYFILRDDIKFAKVENKEAINSQEIVSAEDVVFSMNRAKNKNSVPNHKTYTLHSSMENIEIVDSLDELETKKESGKDISIKESLEKNLQVPITKVTTNKGEVNNKDGVYQVVKITTKIPFPQVLNYLAHQSAGIVSKDQVETVNTYKVEEYDVNKDVSYGDQSTVAEGYTYNNTLMTSGPYIMIYKNDYEAVFQKNPEYMVGTEYEPKIKTVVVKFIKDTDSALSAFRSGETYVTYDITEDKLSLVQNDSKFDVQTVNSNRVIYAIFNLNGNSKFSNEDLRKAVLYSINQDEILSVYGNLKVKVYSTVSTIVDTGNKHEANLDKVKEYISKYYESN